jgi:ribonuclease HII
LEKFESQFKQKGFDVICGVDEAGRGSLAGPVVAAAVVLNQDVNIEDIKDSKLLSAKKREQLFCEISENSIDFCISEASSEEIDKLNILNATLLAMQRAVNGLNTKPDIALIDGNVAPKLNLKSKTIVHGDSICISIAAASILAKVYRDSLMFKCHTKYPIYNFSKHKGYGTKFHFEAIKKYGLCPIHRKSFKLFK